MRTAKKVAMTLSFAGLAAIAGFEGFSDTAYVPVKGDAWTIGFGHTGGVHPGDKVTPAEALSLLSKDTAAAEAAVNSAVKVRLTQHQFDALVSLTYNIGATAFKNSTLLRCLNIGNEVCVDEQWMRWKYFHGKPLAGLEKRRAQELFIYHGGSPVGYGDRVCFGSAGCYTRAELLQESAAGPDGAEGGAGS